MTTSSHPEMPIYRRVLRLMAFLLLILPGLLAFAIGVKFDFGQGTEPLFFEVMAAGVLPVLLVACIVQYSVLFGRMIAAEIPQKDMEIVRYKHARNTELYGLIFIAGESAALYAIAAGQESTFLLLATAFYGLILLFLLLAEVRGLGDAPESFLPATNRRRRQERLREAADRHEALAADARATAAAVEAEERPG